MTAAQRTILLTHLALLAQLTVATDLTAYQQAIEALFQHPGRAIVTLPQDSAFQQPARQQHPHPLRAGAALHRPDDDAQRATLADRSRAGRRNRFAAYQKAIEEMFQQSAAAITNYLSQEVEVALPGGVTLPAHLPSIPIRYNSATQKLSFIGVMTDDERLALKAANPTPHARNHAHARGRIEELFSLPRLAVKFFEPVFTAPLEALPPAVDFKAQLPADLAAENRLRCRTAFAAFYRHHETVLNSRCSTPLCPPPRWPITMPWTAWPASRRHCPHRRAHLADGH